MVTKIAILGDFNPVHSTLHALNDSTRSMKKVFLEELQFDWIGTDLFNTSVVFGKNLYSGLWIAPGSPYKDMQNVLDAITYTRTHALPTFGNCGGFQHMIMEYARNKCDIAHAGHEEVNPDAAEPVISKLACSLVQQQEILTITNTSSRLFQILKKEKITGKYYCSYGLNEKYTAALKKNGLSFTAVSEDGHIRAFELKDHPFFLGTLFQPALTSSDDEPNPLIVAFVQQCLISAEQKNKP